MKKMKFFLCEHCGNLITKVEDSGVPVVCCGENMTELVPNTVDASVEKHVPVPTVDGTNVKVVVSQAAHPMIPEHHIAWVCLETEQGNQIKYLNHTGAPEASFAITEDDKPVAVYAYCNLHGLWSADI